MRRLAICFIVLGLAGCSKAPDEGAAEQSQSFSVAPDEPMSNRLAPPEIGVTAAPGVAFTYRYAFRLPPTAIAATQEVHAAACEKLGLARCRITGMRYRLIGENDVEAMLAFKLAPDLARVFGREGIRIVEAAKGSLVDAAIAGTDTAENTARLEDQRSRAAAETARIDAQLARGGRDEAERAELQRQRAVAGEQVAAARAGVAEQQALLTSTPMTFVYEAGPAIRGFDTSAPLTGALDVMVRSAELTLGVLLMILAVLGPPALAFGAAWLAWRHLWPQVGWLFSRDKADPPS